MTNDVIEVVVIGGKVRCVYLNNFRIVGRKPWADEPQKSKGSRCQPVKSGSSSSEIQRARIMSDEKEAKRKNVFDRRIEKQNLMPYEKLSKLLSYDPVSGHFTWLVTITRQKERLAAASTRMDISISRFAICGSWRIALRGACIMEAGQKYISTTRMA